MVKLINIKNVWPQLIFVLTLKTFNGDSFQVRCNHVTYQHCFEAYKTVYKTQFVSKLNPINYSTMDHRVFRFATRGQCIKGK